MNAYDVFASVYDVLNTEIDYEKMADRIVSELESAGVGKGALVLDLGCGTGTLTKLLSERGYDMIGVDGSEEMLSRARENGGEGILYLEQDLTGFELYGTVAAIVSTTDTLNHITDPDDLLRVFRLAHNYLDPGGLFIFDLNSRAKFETLYNSRDYVLEDDGIFLSWQTEYCPEDSMADFYITLFERKPDGSWERADSEFSERCYDHEQIASMLSDSGFEIVRVTMGYGGEDVGTEPTRQVFTARRNMA